MATQITFDGVPIKDIDLMTPDEVADLYRVSKDAVSRWGLSGKLTRIVTPGGGIRYLRSEVTAKLNGSLMERVADGGEAA